MKVMSIFGTRPEIIRLSRIFSKLDSNFEHIMVNTNQNFTPELSQIFFSDLKIRKPDYNLRISTGQYGKEIADIIQKSEKIILKEKPDIILILGDTNSGLAAIPAAHHGVKIVHLEAGMRSYDSRMPEEKNRVLIDHLSSILLPYTNYSRENLIRENIHPSKIYVVGNPIIEVIDFYMPKIEQSSILEKMKLKTDSYFLVTAHRSENVDNPETLSKIISGLEKIHFKFKKRVIYPIHPRTLSKLKKKIPKGVECIKPLGFFDFTKLEKNAFCLITDSGTIPEESLYFKKPCITIRDSTERPEYIESGSNILSGLEPQNLINSIKLATSSEFNLEWDKSLGDGKTSLKVANILQGKIDRQKYE
ncbi:UDP-N-acetylglucosamine 2-epimerase protein [Marine Group I thaumarchaeote SCGC RSA3]|uniref:UDP-N-acetylglucosamine 2-epimerase protein n=2 Tax=Marine Group I TaxID=905826 RepID=A0A087RM30_9ARCH|nr:UDP-N-acetylglucosamine 2-epimerase protein [Marine Group I thaumarchaeote SCGC AAA799-D11]KFM19928.1 UDP-N-acetylglucosamine 2-epimerase protein [Marine Group I thaumarchaeote SCGC RSA3]